MADFAVAQVLRETDLAIAVLGILIAPDGVVLTTRSKFAVEQSARMDLVHHGGHVKLVAAVGIHRTGVVAHHTILGVNATTAMQGQFFVATIAGGHIGHFAGQRWIGHRNGLAGGINGEVKVRIDQDRLARCILVAELDRDAVGTVALKGHTVGLRRVGDIGLEGVAVVAIRVVHQLCSEQRCNRLFSIRGRLHGGCLGRYAVGSNASGCSFLAIGVAHPLVTLAGRVAWNQLGHDHRHIGRRKARHHLAVREDREVHFGGACHGHHWNTGSLQNAEWCCAIGRRIVGRDLGRRRNCRVRGGHWLRCAATATTSAPASRQGSHHRESCTPLKK